MNTVYNTNVGKFKLLLPPYNDAVDAEAKRLTSAFNSAFVPAINIPERPCPPTQPYKWNIFELNLVLSS
jgi:hypothetical protein